jgi:hypothetical protein
MTTSVERRTLRVGVVVPDTVNIATLEQDIRVERLVARIDYLLLQHPVQLLYSCTMPACSIKF